MTLEICHSLNTWTITGMVPFGIDCVQAGLPSSHASASSARWRAHVESCYSLQESDIRWSLAQHDDTRVYLLYDINVCALFSDLFAVLLRHFHCSSKNIALDDSGWTKMKHPILRKLCTTLCSTDGYVSLHTVLAFVWLVALRLMLFKAASTAKWPSVRASSKSNWI